MVVSLNEVFAGAVHPLWWYLQEGLVIKRSHKKLPLSILNYTSKCQHGSHWDTVTRQCRGLIYNHKSMEVLARPFEKFFNWDEPQSPPIPDDVPGVVQDKLDGSLGILYPTGNGWAIATRGSFHSDQAKWATKRLQQYLDDWEPLPEHTYCFEIVYPENRIVLDYGSTADIFLLSVMHTKTRLEFDDGKWVGPRVETLRECTFREALEDTDLHSRTNREGFVWLQWGVPLRVKVKQWDYVEKHRVIFGLNERTIWRALSDEGQNIDEFILELPEEAREWAVGCAESLWRQYLNLNDLAYSTYNNILDKLGNEHTRKEFAELATLQDSIPSLVLFYIFDGKSIKDPIWKMVYPNAPSKYREG